ncbi:MAG: recombination protein RecR [Chloroflexi bacterium]|nr:recombination protein RecR [Chloroflexota bacterium]
MTTSPTSPTVARLIEALHRLPGIGPKTAQRLTYHMVRMPIEEARSLSEAILAIKTSISFCSSCQNITETDPCPLCSDPRRDRSQLCVVEEPLDILPLERSGKFSGLYHVLHGVISPMNGIGPEELKIRELLERLKDGQVKEVIMGINPNLEGDATCMYINGLISPLGITVTRLARGLPAGGDLEYVDDLTLARALEGRQPI